MPILKILARLESHSVGRLHHDEVLLCSASVKPGVSTPAVHYTKVNTFHVYPHLYLVIFVTIMEPLLGWPHVSVHTSIIVAFLMNIILYVLNVNWSRSVTSIFSSHVIEFSRWKLLLNCSGMLGNAVESDHIPHEALVYESMGQHHIVTTIHDMKTRITTTMHGNRNSHNGSWGGNRSFTFLIQNKTSAAKLSLLWFLFWVNVWNWHCKER